MSLIACSADCQYQKDGYCELDMPGTVTNVSHPGCAHYIRIESGNTPRGQQQAENIPSYRPDQQKAEL